MVSYRPPGLDRDRCDILEQRTTTGPAMQVKKEWVAIATGVPCRATELRGWKAVELAQRGFKKPWIVLFPDDPKINPSTNRLRVVDSNGVHEIEVRSFRNEGGTTTFWGVEGDEDTNKPLVGK